MDSRDEVEVSRPCISFETTTAKAKYETEFVIEKAAVILEESGLFDRVKTSARLGLLKTYGEKKLILFEDGTVTLSPSGNAEEAYEYFNRIGDLLWDAQMCRIYEPAAVGDCKRECPEECPFREKKRIRLVNEKQNRI